MPEQLTLEGKSVPQGTIKDRIVSILRRHPDARNSYHALMFWYWLEVDGMEDVLDGTSSERFRKWFVSRATSAKTLQNRCLEIQREHPGLDATDEVREWRDDQATAGPVGS